LESSISLKHLDVSFTKLVLNPETVASLSKLTRLEELVMLRLEDKTGNSLAELVAKLPKLQKLDACKPLTFLNPTIKPKFHSQRKLKSILGLQVLSI
jgi:hypothetical protein